MRTAVHSYTGHGNVSSGERWLAWVSYSIRTWLATSALDPVGPEKVIQDYAYGLLRVQRGELNLPQNAVCILELEDGRRCRVYFTLIGDPSLDNYTIHFVDPAEIA